MGNFFSELKRRHIYRVAAAYAVVAWVLLQLINNVAPVLDLPSWVARAFLLALVIGFPLAIFFAWMRELPPADEAAAHAKTGMFDWVLMGALVVVIAGGAYQQLAPMPGSSPVVQQASVSAARSAAADPHTDISLAVLPFVNLSSDKDQEFFSDGMTEEITSALAKIQTLRVVGRTSAFEFKGQNRDLRAIGQALSATHLIEGSVRKDGNQVRITAQLIKADDGTHIWTESYDRELKGVFAVQEEIAEAIAGALRVPLGLKQGSSLVSSRTEDLESYQQYLRAKSLMQARGIEPIADVVTLLEPVVAHDPQFAPAWALLAQAYVQEPTDLPRGNLSGSGTQSVVAKNGWAESAAQQAIRLDPNHSDGYVSLGITQVRNVKWLAAEDLYRKALALDPNNPEALQQYRDLLAAVGHLKQALSFQERLSSLEPFVPVYNRNTAFILWLNGRTDAAITILKALPADYATRGRFLAQVYAAAGRFREAAEALMTTPADAFAPALVNEAIRLLRLAPSDVRSPQSVPYLGQLGFVHVYIGDPVRLLESYERAIETGTVGPTNMSSLWHSRYIAVRKTERFKAFARKAGLVEYWRARGWPDLCRPVGADDFECN